MPPLRIFPPSPHHTHTSHVSHARTRTHTHTHTDALTRALAVTQNRSSIIHETTLIAVPSGGSITAPHARIYTNARTHCTRLPLIFYTTHAPAAACAGHTRLPAPRGGMAPVAFSACFTYTDTPHTHILTLTHIHFCVYLLLVRSFVCWLSRLLLICFCRCCLRSRWIPPSPHPPTYPHPIASFFPTLHRAYSLTRVNCCCIPHESHSPSITLARPSRPVLSLPLSPCLPVTRPCCPPHIPTHLKISASACFPHAHHIHIHAHTH